MKLTQVRAIGAYLLVTGTYISASDALAHCFVGSRFFPATLFAIEIRQAVMGLAKFRV